jgi:hypothetical protein
VSRLPASARADWTIHRVKPSLRRDFTRRGALIVAARAMSGAAYAGAGLRNGSMRQRTSERQAHSNGPY